MSLKGHPVEVVHLAFHGLGPRVEVEQRRDDRVLLGHLDPDSRPLPAPVVDQRYHHLETLTDHAFGQIGSARVGDVVHRGEIDDHVVAVVA